MRRKYQIKLEAQDLIGSGDKDQQRREASIMKLISQLNANPNTMLSAEEAGNMLRRAEERYQLSLEQ